MGKRTSFTYPLDSAQQSALLQILNQGNYRSTTVEHAQAAADGEDYRVVLYKSGKCLVQGRGAEDFVLFVLEPDVLKSAGVGYEDVLDPDALRPRMGVDESGKGDFFGPLVVAAAYVDEPLVGHMRELGVKDSKSITSDKRMTEIARELHKGLGSQRYTLVSIGPAAYNRLYAKMRNVNRILAWAHARAIENLLDQVPDCPMAISDQFGNKSQVEKALMAKGRKIELIQRHKAESDIAVAAASILARARFIHALKEMAEKYGAPFPKGASAAVRAAAIDLVGKREPNILLETAKCHFKTTDAVLTQLNLTRDTLGPEGQIVSKTAGRRGKPSD